MRHDRELIALAKSQKLETIADRLQRTPTAAYISLLRSGR
jgi:hypothetical protein